MTLNDDTMASVQDEVKQIKDSLDALAEYMAWMIPAEQRFRVGDRVEWSRKARKQGFLRRKHCERGTVKKVGSFTITVKLDGLKHPKRFHHGFFNPLNGLKLF